MKKLLVIVGDTNDADYITSVNILDTDDEYSVEILNLLPKLSLALKNCKNYHNWPNHEYVDEDVREIYDGVLTTDEIEIVHEYVPRGEFGIHSIKSVDVYDITNIVNYL